MILERFKVSGRSMEPAFYNGDKLLVSNLIYEFREPEAGDVVVLSDPRDGRPVLKRIRQIKDEKYSVVGDNESESTDSRVFGPVIKQQILGKVIWCYRRS